MKTITKKGKTALKLQEVCSAILAIKIEPTTTLKSITNQFYSIMRTHGICQGTWTKNGHGRSVANPEWSLCVTFLQAHISGALSLHLLLAEVPADLKAYGKRPTPAHERALRARKRKASAAKKPTAVSKK